MSNRAVTFTIIAGESRVVETVLDEPDRGAESPESGAFKTLRFDADTLAENMVLLQLWKVREGQEQ